MEVVYEDNHVIIVNKEVGEIVQGDKTGDQPLSETVKEYIKKKYQKPGNVFIGVVHRLDRPVSGLVMFAKTSKALERLNRMFREGDVHKRYWALVQGKPDSSEGLLENWLVSQQKNNKTYIVEAPTEKNPNPKAKLARLEYRTIAEGDRYTLLEINLLTGRKHQIRAQLAGMGHPIKGDLKYGAKRSNPDGGISLQSHSLEFIHPVSKQEIRLELEPTEEMAKLFVH